MIYAASPWAVLLSEHRPVACVPSGHSVRCDLRMFSAVKLRWAHRLPSLSLRSVPVGESVPSHKSRFLDFARNHRSGAGQVCRTVVLSLRHDVLDYRMPFQFESNYKPRGDQGQAIAKLTKSLEAGIGIRLCLA